MLIKGNQARCVICWLLSRTDFTIKGIFCLINQEMYSFTNYNPVLYKYLNRVCTMEKWFQVAHITRNGGTGKKLRKGLFFFFLYCAMAEERMSYFILLLGKVFQLKCLCAFDTQTQYNFE